MNIDSGSVEKWLEKGSRAVTPAQIPSLCHTLSQTFSKEYALQFNEKYKKEVPERSRKRMSRRAFDRCLQTNIYYPNIDEMNLGGLSMHRQLLVKKTGKFSHKAGKNMNINVGNDFSVGHFNSTSRDSSASLNLVGIAGGLGLAMTIVPGVGNLALLAAAGITLATTAPGFTKSTSSSLGYTRSQGSSVSAGTYLVVQRAEVEIELRKYERCMVVRLNSQAYRKSRRFFQLKKSQYDESLLSQAFNKGHFICEGKITDKSDNPDTVTEEYYYVTQHFTAGDILDNGSLLNHVWLLAIRGRQDFNRFKSIVNARPIDHEGNELNINSADYPLEVLERAYSKITPSFPGMYSVRE